jgi:stage V sporulation protein AA
MKTDQAPAVYLRLRKKVRVHRDQAVTLGMIAQIWTEPEREREIRSLEIYRPRPDDGNLFMIDMLRIIGKLKQAFPGIKVELYGEPQTLVVLEPSERRVKWFVVVFVWLLLFFGSGLAIMNFHADVSMMKVHRRIVEIVSGKTIRHPYWMQIPYSIGIGIGMILFFNHIFKKKLNEEPSPLEVEMYLYEENVNQYSIAEEYRKMSANEGDDRQ